MNPSVKEHNEEDKGIICNFCRTSKIDTLKLGQMYSLENVTTHYFCLLFSSNLSQNGEDDEGIWGFLPKDIKKELSRGKRLKCNYCKKPGATIGCSISTCKFKYHYSCGYDNGSLFQFIGNYASFCRTHRQTLKITVPREDWRCVCYDDDFDSEPFPLKPPCCSKNSAVYHRMCMMKQADESGIHQFKCPACRNEEEFSVFMRNHGIYVPYRDSKSELENAFADLYRVYSRCDEEECLCPSGRTFSSDDKDNENCDRSWTIVRCGGCGARGVHIKCANLTNKTYRCEDCAKPLHGFRFSSDEEDEDESELDEDEDASELNMCHTNGIHRAIESNTDEGQEDLIPRTDIGLQNHAQLDSPRSLAGSTSFRLSKDEEDEEDSELSEIEDASELSMPHTNGMHRAIELNTDEEQEDSTSRTDIDLQNSETVQLDSLRTPHDSTNPQILPSEIHGNATEQSDNQFYGASIASTVLQKGVKHSKRDKEKVFGREFRVVGIEEEDELNDDLMDDELYGESDEEMEELFIPDKLTSAIVEEVIEQQEKSENLNISRSLLSPKKILQPIDSIVNYRNPDDGSNIIMDECSSDKENDGTHNSSQNMNAEVLSNLTNVGVNHTTLEKDCQKFLSPVKAVEISTIPSDELSSKKVPHEDYDDYPANNYQHPEKRTKLADCFNDINDESFNDSCQNTPMELFNNHNSAGIINPPSGEDIRQRIPSPDLTDLSNNPAHSLSSSNVSHQSDISDTDIIDPNDLSDLRTTTVTDILKIPSHVTQQCDMGDTDITKLNKPPDLTTTAITNTAISDNAKVQRSRNVSCQTTQTEELVNLIPNESNDMLLPLKCQITDPHQSDIEHMDVEDTEGSQTFANNVDNSISENFSDNANESAHEIQDDDDDTDFGFGVISCVYSMAPLYESYRNRNNVVPEFVDLTEEETPVIIDLTEADPPPPVIDLALSDDE